MAGAWVERPVRLKFALGEVSLFTTTFPFLVYDAHFTELTTDLDEPRPPLDAFPGARGALVRSHPVEADLPRVSRVRDLLRYVPNQYDRYYVSLTGSFADYLKKFSSKSRSTLLRKVRRFAEFSGGEVRWREFRKPDEMDEFHRLARTVSEKTYQERLLDAGLPDTPEFRRRMAELAAQDAVRAYVLFHGDGAVAYLYCPAQEGVLLYEYLGYDPQFAEWSPGTVLQHLALEKLFAEGRFRMFDFTEGGGPHKQFFATGSTRCADVYLFRRAARSLLLVNLHARMDGMSATLGRALDSLGLKRRIKKLLRSKS